MNKEILKGLLDSSTSQIDMVEGVPKAFISSSNVKELMGDKVSGSLKTDPAYINFVMIYGLMEEVEKLKEEVKELKDDRFLN